MFEIQNGCKYGSLHYALLIMGNYGNHWISHCSFIYKKSCGFHFSFFFIFVLNRDLERCFYLTCCVHCELWDFCCFY